MPQNFGSVVFFAPNDKKQQMSISAWWKSIWTKQQKAWPMTEQEADQEGGGWLKQS